MRIGVDFDNTIVCYDALFHRVALEQKLIPPELPVNKSEVRNYLRRAGKEPLWTEMQGDVYGARMAEAAPFPGVLEFFQQCRQANIAVSIISHKTRHPFLGEKHDLHAAAANWLELQGFFDPDKIGLPRAEVFFELTKEAKLARIAQRKCDHFIDDLPEILAEPSFPAISRILFDPADLYSDETRFFRAKSWAVISKRLISEPEGFREFAVRGGLASPITVEPMSGGGNNRVYFVSDGKQKTVLKQYFRQAADARDRFASERAFYGFLWGRGLRRTPEPLAWDAEKRLGLFEFIDGEKLRSADAEAVDQAMQFIVELNQDTSAAAGLPNASEACFSMEEHVAVIDRRVARLAEIEPSHTEAVAFVQESLQPAWRKIRAAIRGSSPARRILSPSDFGFHNALRPADGRLRFFDFEYAGWDDPAKLICDFFCQPQVPVPLEYWDRVTAALGDKALAERARLLLPAYQIKWCCIMLNEFARHDRERRDFAQGAATSAQRKIAQLAKARAAFQTISHA